MSKFLDPIANASVLGVLFILSGLLNLAKSIGGFAQSPIYGAIILMIAAFNMATGFGLRKSKLWAVYLIGLNVLVSLVLVLVASIEGTFTSLMLVDTGIIGALFFWFYSAKERFVK